MDPVCVVIPETTDPELRAIGAIIFLLDGRHVEHFSSLPLTPEAKNRIVAYLVERYRL